MVSKSSLQLRCHQTTGKCLESSGHAPRRLSYPLDIGSIEVGLNMTRSQILTLLKGQEAPMSRVNAKRLLKDQAFLSDLNRKQLDAAMK